MRYCGTTDSRTETHRWPLALQCTAFGTDSAFHSLRMKKMTTGFASGYVITIKSHCRCRWQQPMRRLAAWVSWHELRFGSHLALCLHSPHKLCECSQRLCYEGWNNTITRCMVILFYLSSSSSWLIRLCPHKEHFSRLVVMYPLLVYEKCSYYKQNWLDQKGIADDDTYSHCTTASASWWPNPLTGPPVVMCMSKETWTSEPTCSADCKHELQWVEEQKHDEKRQWCSDGHEQSLADIQRLNTWQQTTQQTWIHTYYHALMIRIGVSGWKFLLVPAYPGCPGSKAVKRSLLLYHALMLPYALWQCWLGVRKSIQPVKIQWWGVGVVICLQWGADCLHMVQLMPLYQKNPIISCLI